MCAPPVIKQLSYKQMSEAQTHSFIAANDLTKQESKSLANERSRKLSQPFANNLIKVKDTSSSNGITSPKSAAHIRPKSSVQKRQIDLKK